MIESIEKLSSTLSFEMKKSSNVFFIGHNSPDFDSIAACIGLFVMAESFGKKAYIIVDDPDVTLEPGVKKIIDQNRSLFKIIKKENFFKKVNDTSLLVVCDVNKKSMISIGDYVSKMNHVIVIDHHSEGEDSIETPNKYITQEASSACEVVSQILAIENIPYSSDVANYLLSGISLDTKRFKQNTTAETHDVAVKLIEHGADIDFVNNLFLEEFESFCRISNLIVNGTIIKKYSESLLAPIQVSFTLNRNQPEAIYMKEDYAKASDRMLKFNGIDAAFALGFVEPGVVHISARGGKKVNVGLIMQEMGGGGNAQAAGGRIVTSDIHGLEEELMSKIPSGISEEEKLVEEPQIIKVKQIKKELKK